MSIVSKTYLRTKFITGAKPTQQDFGDFIDSAVFFGSAQTSAGTFGLQMLATETTAQAQDILDISSLIPSFSAIGKQIVSAATTAAVQNILTEAFTLSHPTLVSAGANAISFGNASLNYYDTGSFIGTCTGAISTTTTIKYTRSGSEISLFFPANSVGGAASASPITISGLPAALIPPNEMYMPILRIQDNGSPITANAGVLRITAGGGIIIYKDLSLSNFTSSTNSTGYFGFGISYSL